MKYWGDIIYSREILCNEVFVVVTDFNFNQSNFNRWIKNHSLSNKQYTNIGDAGYGYTIIQHNTSAKQAIKTPDGRMLCRAVFDDIIGFFNHFGYDKQPVAIGFIGERVYKIPMDGMVELLPMSKDDFLKMPQPNNEAYKCLKMIIRECVRDVLRG